MRANERKEESRGLGSILRVFPVSFLSFQKRLTSVFPRKDTFEKESANVLKQNSSFYRHRSLGTGKQRRSLVPRACRVGTPDRL